MRIAAMIAVQAEAEAVLADTFFGWREEDRGTAIYRSADGNVRLAVSGIGKVFASHALTRLLAGAGGDSCELVLALGTSGSLGREPVGSLCLCPEAVERDMDTSGIGTPPGVTAFSGMRGPVIRACPDALFERVRAAIGGAGFHPLSGRALSGDSFITGGEEADRARALFGGAAAGEDAPEALLVDMETAAIAKLCAYRLGKPFLALRWVSDNADGAAADSWTANVRRSSADFAACLRALARA